MIVSCAHCSLEFDLDSQKSFNPFVGYYCDDCLEIYKNHRERGIRNFQEEEDSFFPRGPVPYDCNNCSTPMRLSWVLPKKNSKRRKIEKPGEPVRAWVCPKCGYSFRAKKKDKDAQ